MRKILGPGALGARASGRFPGVRTPVVAPATQRVPARSNGRGASIVHIRRWSTPLAAASYAAAAIHYRRAPHAAEQRLFTRINDSGETRWLRLPQQLGTPWTLPVVAALALVRGRPRETAVAALALPAVKAVEVATKKLTDRPRPVHNQPTALRDDAPVEGGSFPSGHVGLAVAATLQLAPHVPRPVTALLAGSVAASSYARISQGAHYPSDAVGGALLGVAVSGSLTALADRFPPRR